MIDRSHAVDSAAHLLRRQIADAQEKLDRINMLPRIDAYKHGEMIRLTVRPRYGNDAERTYLLLKIADPNWSQAERSNGPRWYFTGTLSGRGNGGGTGYRRWDQIISWIVNDVELVEWVELVPKQEWELTDEIELLEDEDGAPLPEAIQEAHRAAVRAARGEYA